MTAFSKVASLWHLNKYHDKKEQFMRYSLSVSTLGLFSVFLFGFTPLHAEQTPEMKEQGKCWIISSIGSDGVLFDAWKALFAPLDITCEFKGNIKEMDETADLSKVKFMLVDTPIINEGFARSIEKWVKAGGVIITSRPPVDYYGPPGHWLPFVNLGGGTKLNQGLLRPFSAAAGTGGTLVSIDGPAYSSIFTHVKEAGLSIQDKDIVAANLQFITGWADRDFGPDMTLLEGRIKTKDSGEIKATLMIHNRYGLGWGYYTTLPLNSKTILGSALRSGLMRQIALDMKAGAPSKKLLYNNPPGIAAKSVKAEASVPERPAPPSDCLLELHGDEFSGSIGSPSWAPWRIACAPDERTPIEKEFAISKTDAPLWMEIKGCYGDHTDPPSMSVTFNGVSLFNGICPWDKIQYSAQYYGSMRPIRIYLPKEILRKMNKLSVVNYGPEWFVLDYVRFFPVTGARSLEKTEAADKPGKFEVKVSKVDPIAVDGNPAKPAWEHAAWMPIGLEEEGEKSVKSDYSAAFVADDENLYVGLRSRLEDTVAELAISYPGCESQYRICFDGKREAYVQNTDGEIVPTIQLKSASSKTAEGGAFIEAAIPLACIPRDSSMAFRPSSASILPMGAHANFNFIVRSRDGKIACSWTSFLPFEMNGKPVRQMSRMYQTRLPYPLVYDSKWKGGIYNLPVVPSCILWTGKLDIGVNKVVVDNSRGVYSSARIVMRPSGQARRELSFKLSGGRQTLEFPLNLPFHTDVSVELFDSTGRLVALDMRPCPIEKPLHAVAGFNYYTTEKEASIHIRSNCPGKLVGKPERLSVSMSMPDGSLQTVAATTSPSGNPGELIARFDISSCPPGIYQTAIDCAVNGSLLHTPGPDIAKHPPSKSEVKIRNDGFISVNGKSLYPLGLLMDQCGVTPDASFIKEGGLNTALYWQEQTKERLDKMLKDEIYLIISPPGDKDNGPGKWIPDYAKTKRHLENLKEYRNLLGYYPVDEPEYWYAPACVPLQLKAFNEFVASIDPYHPSMISHGVGGIHYDKSEGLTFNDVVDIRIYELYGNPDKIARRFDMVRTLGRNDKASPWVFLKLGPNVAPEDPVQFRANVYTSFACGAKGIFFFLLSSARWTGHELWPEVSKGVCDEITAMAASRMASGSMEVKSLSSDDKVRTMAWRDGGLLWIVAANTSEDIVDAQISLEGDLRLSGTVKKMFNEMPSASREGKTFRASFARYDVACWTIGCN